MNWNKENAMQLKRLEYPYPFVPPEKRAELLPERSICSVAPAVDPADAFYTGNGSHRIDVAGWPYNDRLTANMELLQEPKWKSTPLPPDMRPYLKEIRKALLEGRPDLADRLQDRAQRETGHDAYIDLDRDIVYPIGSISTHEAFGLSIIRPEAEDTRDYLRWVDMSTGLITTRWENAEGVFKNEYLCVYQGDFVAVRLSAPEGKLDAAVNIRFPGGRGPFGNVSLKNSVSETKRTAELITAVYRYDPELCDDRGFALIFRFIPEGGELALTDDGVRAAGGSGLIVMAKAVRYETGFFFGCEAEDVSRMTETPAEPEAWIRGNRAHIGSRMDRSRLRLASGEESLLSGEELLRRCRTGSSGYPALMDKLYDLGRFYQITDTGKLPPMWGQHNINTNLQVCAGNNTGLFDEMEVYFRYYESKTDDFRVNARRLFNARGILASVHCDYDSGLLYHTSRTYPHYAWTGCMGWVCNEMWGYYLCTGDLDFLRERLVPLLKETALFYEDYACDRDGDGKVIFYPSFSPENPTPNPDYATVTGRDRHATRINSVMDIAICREVLTNLSEACRTLGIEEENVPRWQKLLEDLPVLLTDEEGALKEWAWPAMEENYNHRHVSHHYDVWPGRAVTPETEPELAQAIRISNRKRGQQDDSAHGIIHRALTAIRLKDTEELDQNLSQLVEHGFVRRSLSTAHFPYRGQFPDLQGAMPAILLEMCVFSAPGTVEFLPALPDWLPKGVLEGIWLYTRVKLESLSWDAEGLRSELVPGADGTLTLRCRRPISSFRVNGEELSPQGDSVSVSVRAEQRLTVDIRFRRA
ncbi:MAG: glycoside hydrolase N-terminal domain-containing protein [Oscillospiraceae bacterium]|nr:glycoside hydrolase N-terminal domain-containing protein [Oscillospiraceae bacterium]